jgi:hypothetical protein
MGLSPQIAAASQQPSGVQMSYFVNAARAAAGASLVCGFAWLGPATATADTNSETLAGLLSKGYSTSNCNVEQVEGTLAAYKCGKNTDSGGPLSAEYLLYGSSGDTANAFKGGTSALVLASCSSGQPAAATTWHYKSSPDTPAGQVACGTSDNVPEVVWTNDQKHMFAVVAASDTSLYQWWAANG